MGQSDEELYCNYYIYNLTKTFLQQTASPSKQPYVAQTLRSDVTLLPASLALNFCLLTSGFICAFLRREWESPSRRKFFSAEENRKDVSKCFAEHLLTLGLFLAAVYLLCTTQLLYQPFVYCGDKTLILLAVSVNLGKYVYLTYDAILHRHNEGFVPLLIHHVVTLACYLVTAVWGENLLPAVLGLLMDSSTLCLSLKTLLVRAGVPKDAVRLLVARLGGSVSNIVFRGVVPVVFMAIAFIYQSPNIMKPMSLAALAMEMVFFSVINIYLIACSFRKILSVMGDNETDKTEYILNDIKTEKPPLAASDEPVISVNMGSEKLKSVHMKPVSNVNVGPGNKNSFAGNPLNIDGKARDKVDVRASISNWCYTRSAAQTALLSGMSGTITTPPSPTPLSASSGGVAGSHSRPSGRNNNNNTQCNLNNNVHVSMRRTNARMTNTLSTISEASEEVSSVASTMSDTASVHSMASATGANV